MKKTFDLKSGVCLDDICMLNPKLMTIFATVLNFAAKHDLPVTVTSLIHDRDGIVSKSSTHSQGRAIDLSIKDWPKARLGELEKIIEDKHFEIGAISSKTLKPRPIVIHDSGYGPHIHLQVRP